MTFMRLRVAIVGAGMAGLSCARHLQSAGCRVVVYDKGRVPGGRMSTRRGDHWQCDHGAQYFTARDPAFHAEVMRWQAAGVAGLWTPSLAVLGGGADVPQRQQERRYVGVPRMNAPAAWMSAGLEVHKSITVTDMRHDDAGWRLISQEEGLHAEHYDALVLAMPSPQAAALLEPLLPLTALEASAAAMQPCWTLMLRFRSRQTPGYDAAFVNDGPLRWIARDSGKPGRQGDEVWVLQASPEWSVEHVEDDEDNVKRLLLAAYARLGGESPDAVVAHRWRYARAAAPSDRQCVWLPAVQVGLCGDWLGGGRVEDAWLSGRAMATRLLRDPGIDQKSVVAVSANVRGAPSTR